MSSSSEFLAAAGDSVRDSSGPTDGPSDEGGCKGRAPAGEGSAGRAAGIRSVLRAVLGAPRRVAGFVRHLPDRLLHDGRRRKASRVTEEGPRPASVLFLCMGNVCRSPYAERAFRRRLPTELLGRVEVRSAGFSGWDRPSPREAVEEAGMRGIDLSRHRSRVLTHDLVDATDLFVVTTGRQARKLARVHGIPRSSIVHLGDLDPEPIRTRDVVDPWGKDRAVFRDSYDRIDRCVERLARLIARPGAPADDATA